MYTKTKLLSLILVLSISIASFAQKLPVKQKASVFAPVAIRIDGKTTEWRSLQAYNPATEISYTMFNDNEKLYLTCQATEIDVIQKVIVGGITLTISHIDQKACTAPVSITYPIVPFNYAQVDYALRTPAPLDQSTVSLVNSRITDHLTVIKISGLKEFPDSSISIHNDRGIIGAHFIGSSKVYSYELAFPLTLIRHLINSQNAFNYKVQVTGFDMKKTVMVGGPKGRIIDPSDKAVPHDDLFLMSPTFFKSTYTLAKK